MARKLIEQSATTYDAATVHLLGAAFDQAWTKIADRYQDPVVIASKRNLLANAILDLASVGMRDISTLVQGAIMAVDHSERPKPIKQ